jgi:2-polyprenyl-3-methyl-5-hydroxy-6-metoxy-1,4-benzoquinol methylase
MSTSVNASHSLRDQVILANQEFYRQIAGKYDQYEYCASDPFFQNVIEQDLEIIKRKLPSRSEPIRCLDCGGGTGNVTLKMLRRGWQVTVVDVSADMLNILRTKVVRSGLIATFVHDSVENFLSSSQETFDVISFSSVLHHLYSPLNVVASAATSVRPGGFFYSIFDPVPPSSKSAAACFSALDTILAKIIYDRDDFLPGLRRRLRKLRTPRDSTHGRAVVSAGDLAEYHARHGIDDDSLAETLAKLSFNVERRRYAVGRTPLMRSVNSFARVLLNFRILAQRTGSL